LTALLGHLTADIKALTPSSPNIVSELTPAFEKYNEEQFITVKLPGSSSPVRLFAPQREQNPADAETTEGCAKDGFSWTQVIVSSHNSLGDGRYFDVESSSSFAFDHATQVRGGTRHHCCAVGSELKEDDADSECGAKSCCRGRASRPRVSLGRARRTALSTFDARLMLLRRKSAMKGVGAYVKEHFPSAAYGAYPTEGDSKVAVIIVANKYSPNNFWYEPLREKELQGTERAGVGLTD
jgi:hypothetical protein